MASRVSACGAACAAVESKDGEAGFVPGPEFTPHMVKKARRLVSNCLCAEVASKVWQVCSSDGSSYFVTTRPDDCQCMSFKIRRVCSHVLAAQMLEAGVGGDAYKRPLRSP